jgi:hypothetical protein
MARREKIILAVMVAVIAYAAWDFLLRPAPQRPAALAPADGSANGFLTQMNETLKQLSASQAHEQMVKRAETPWPADPFGQGPVQAAADQTAAAMPEKEIPRQALLSYTGFIKVGEKLLAIVNGMEYETGEAIEPGGMVVEQITPTQIVLKSGGHKARLTIPLEDNE